MYNIAVIGSGYWGPNLVRNLRALPEADVKVVCDKNKKRLKNIQRLYPEIEVTNDYQSVINNNSIDGVAIATPVNTHYPLAKMSLEAGKHTFIEKPMANSKAQCKELIEIADKKSLTLMVGHVFIYTPPVRKIKELIKSGEIGEVFYISTRRLNLGLFQKDINVAWDLAPHDISIVLFLLGENPVSVNCQGKTHINPKIEDITNISLSFKNGRFATIQSSWIDPRKIREITIVGSKKMIVYDDTEPLEKIKVYDKHVNTPPHYDTFAEFQYSYHYGDIYIPYLKQLEPLKAECQDFIDSIKSGKKPLVCGKKGMEVVEILEAASLSLKKDGAAIQI
ncbi:MAG: Gfo/Idh/MocA family oxidoreductase [Spirochaetes bacterium]|nr:Gfo/Idh/MocA family oxidoreductase [Spirochaetota bacterium]